MTISRFRSAGVQVFPQEEPPEERQHEDQVHPAEGAGHRLHPDHALAHQNRQHRDESQQGHHSATQLAARRPTLGGLGGDAGVDARGAEVLPAEPVLDDAEEHAQGADPESPVPGRRGVEPHPLQHSLEPGALGESADDQRRDERAEVDAHVEDREAGVAPQVLLAVQLTDDGAHVRLQEPGAENDERQAEVEEFRARHRQAQLAEHDEDAAVEHRAPQPEDAVGDPPARQRQHVHEGHVGAVDGAGASHLEAEPARRHRRRHEEDENGAHAVVREALPHLGEEEGGQPSGVPEEGRIARRRGCSGHEADSWLKWSGATAQGAMPRLLRMSCSTTRSICPSMRTRTS